MKLLILFSHLFFSIGRHSKSISEKHRCSRCKSSLALLPGVRSDGTPRKPRKATAFSLYVKVVCQADTSHIQALLFPWKMKLDSNLLTRSCMDCHPYWKARRVKAESERRERGWLHRCWYLLQTQYAETKAALPFLSHKEIMAILAENYRAEKNAGSLKS